jgi:N utilization substance protein B
MRRRTRAREAAIQFLYQLDLRGEPAIDQLDEFLEQALRRDPRPADPELVKFARRLVVGTRRAQPEIDRLLTAVARNWDLRRMAAVDRNVLRMAVYEMLHCTDIPPKVAINEAIELAKKFSTANSGAFVNGILDRVRLDHVPGRSEARAPDAETLGTEAMEESAG